MDSARLLFYTDFLDKKIIYPTQCCVIEATSAL